VLEGDIQGVGLVLAEVATSLPLGSSPATEAPSSHSDPNGVHYPQIAHYTSCLKFRSVLKLSTSRRRLTTAVSCDDGSPGGGRWRRGLHDDPPMCLQ